MYRRTITLPISPTLRSSRSAALDRSKNSRSVSQSLISCWRFTSSTMGHSNQKKPTQCTRMEWAKGGAGKQRCTTKNARNGGVASRFKLRVPQLTPERQPHENRRTAPRHCKSAGGSNGYGHHLDGAYADTPGSHGNATAPDIATGTATMRRRTGQHFDTRTKRTCSVRGGVAADGKNSNCANLSTATALAISFWRLRHAIGLIGFTSNPSRYSFSSCLRSIDGRCCELGPIHSPIIRPQILKSDCTIGDPDNCRASGRWHWSFISFPLMHRWWGDA